MLYLLIAIISLAIIVGGISYIGHRRFEKRKTEGKLKEGETSPLDTVEVPEECCGQHATCERDSLLAAISKEIMYYDDEELDRHRGKNAEDYDDEEADEFRNIFYELREVEVAGWVRSLQLRSIELPEQVKDEVLLVVRERRFRPVDNHNDHSDDRVGNNHGMTTI